jgi:hypothetical protein
MRQPALWWSPQCASSSLDSSQKLSARRPGRHGDDARPAVWPVVVPPAGRAAQPGRWGAAVRWRYLQDRHGQQAAQVGGGGGLESCGVHHRTGASTHTAAPRQEARPPSYHSRHACRPVCVPAPVGWLPTIQRLPWPSRPPRSAEQGMQPPRSKPRSPYEQAAYQRPPSSSGVGISTFRVGSILPLEQHATAAPAARAAAGPSYQQLQAVALSHAPRPEFARAPSTGRLSGEVLLAPLLLAPLLLAPCCCRQLPKPPPAGRGVADARPRPRPQLATALQSSARRTGPPLAVAAAAAAAAEVRALPQCPAPGGPARSSTPPPARQAWPPSA